jgi:hypothetical protein
LKCLNEETSQTIYVDINATLPKITRTDTNTSWNHGYYFLIEDHFSLEEIQEIVSTVSKYNITYLVPVLKGLIEFKGKIVSTKRAEEQLQDDMDSLMKKYPEVLIKISEFEKFFEIFLEIFLECFHLLDSKQLLRLGWATWSDHNVAFEHFYDQEDKITRMKARQMAGKSTYEGRVFRDWLTAILHSQES